ncbi:MAG TPA: hypothetical protein VEI07_20030, partial [Planctomycetaceae bacterium]|nr:hypothetical protein [Planctomycetaceae bacterium]
MFHHKLVDPVGTDRDGTNPNGWTARWASRTEWNQDIEMRAPSPPEIRVRFADFVTRFKSCLLRRATNLRISQKQELA